MDTQNILLILNTILLAASLITLFTAHRMSKAHKDEAERLYLALPPQWQTTILRLIESADAVIKVTKEVTDGQPNSEE